MLYYLKIFTVSLRDCFSQKKAAVRPSSPVVHLNRLPAKKTFQNNIYKVKVFFFKGKPVILKRVGAFLVYILGLFNIDRSILSIL